MEQDQYIGRLLDNRYEILEVIGTGGMAVVYKARCHRLNRLVAIKILKDEYSRDEEFRRRFHAEGQAVAMLSHPNIVQVYDVSSSDNADYIVMELIDGITLKQYMEKKGVLNWKETLHFAMQIAKALEHAHSRGIVHRDIKPHNVMVLKNGSVKVTDFGIARVVSKSNTLTKEALGSVHYISPEQAKGGRVDNRSDLYSLGVLMYELMTGRPPYDGESPVAVAIQHINGGAVMPSTLNPNIPGGLEQIIMKAMALDPNDRYPSATAMLYDMDEFRKDPTILFDFNGSSMDDVTKIINTAEVARNTVPQMPKTTAERVAGVSQTPHRTPEQHRSATSGTGRTPQQPPKRRPAPVEEEEEDRSRVTTIAIVACSAVAVIAIVIFLVLLINGGLFHEKTKQAEVPNLLGQLYDNLPEYPDFKIVLEKSEYSDEYAKGEVSYQNPEAGDVVVSGSTIVVRVSMGEEPPTPIMPDLVNNQDGQAALDFLRGLEDLKLQILPKEEYSDTVKEGWVTRTEPAEGEELVVGQTVTVWISMGPEVITHKMPNVVGKTAAAAETTLKSNGFNYYEFVEVDSVLPIGEVISQSEDKENDVDVTTMITLEVSKGVLMPEVVGKNVTAAQATLETIGFKNFDIKPVESDRPSGEVTYQSAEANTYVDASTKIVLEVSEGPQETTAPEEDVEKIFRIDLSDVTKDTPYQLTIWLDGDLYGDDVEIQPGTQFIDVMLVGTGIQKYKLLIDNEFYKYYYADFTE